MTPASPPPPAAGPSVHPLRDPMIRELHARPFGVVMSPAQLFHYSIAHAPTSAAEELTFLRALCAEAGAAAPPSGSSHLALQGPHWHLTWERHTEFSSYTFRVLGQRPEEEARALLPRSSLSALPGPLLSDCHVVLVGEDADEEAELARWFGPRVVIGGTAVGGRARLWTPFDTDERGVTRFWIHDLCMTPRQAGRLVQRLLEIHDYTLMAMLGLPAAREIMPPIAAVEEALVEIADRLTAELPVAEEQELLGSLSRLAAAVEALEARAPFRFNAARAYYAIAMRRVQEIREQRIEGQQAIGNFLERRLTPALRTVEATQSRLDSLSERIGRTTQMLRARVDVRLAQQNRDLLASMDRRTQMQLRLQATVEGISVAAITYYAAGLVSYLAQGVNATGLLHLPKELVVGVAVPIIALLVWRGVQRVHRMVSHE